MNHFAAASAKTASIESASLARSAERAAAALQWGIAATLYEQAADALHIDPHTGKPTIQARTYRRHAMNCRAMIGTAGQHRLLKDAPDFRREVRQQMEPYERKRDESLYRHE